MGGQNPPKWGIFSFKNMFISLHVLKETPKTHVIPPKWGILKMGARPPKPI
jgi:hypothetical protein